MKPRSAIIVCDAFPPEVGGMARTAQRLSRYLVIDETPATTLVLKPNTITRHFGTRTTPLQTESVFTSFNRHAELREQLPDLVPLEASPSFVISLYMGRPAHMGSLLAARLGLPFFIVCLGSDLNEHFERFARKWRFHDLVERAAGIGIISPDMRQKLHRFPGGDRKVRLLQAGFDQELFHPLDLPRRYDFLFVGRARPVKGLDRLIAALARIGRPVRVCCVTPHNEADLHFLEECRLRAEADAGHHLFTWLADQPPHHMYQLYNASGCVVIPSRSEGAPHVLLEAMACRRPVIASDVGRIAELMGSHETLFRSDDELHDLLGASLEGNIGVVERCRERALSVADAEDERRAFRRLVGLKEDR